MSGMVQQVGTLMMFRVVWVDRGLPEAFLRR